jgi:hypothetical protein
VRCPIRCVLPQYSGRHSDRPRHESDARRRRMTTLFLWLLFSHGESTARDSDKPLESPPPELYAKLPAPWECSPTLFALK